MHSGVRIRCWHRRDVATGDLAIANLAGRLRTRGATRGGGWARLAMRIHPLTA
jgi:hypothetical protein